MNSKCHRTTKNWDQSINLVWEIIVELTLINAKLKIGERREGERSFKEAKDQIGP
jgi:hypothetical protein